MNPTLKKILPSRSVIGFRVTALTFDIQIGLMLEWAKERLSKAVCIANVQMLTQAYRDPNFAAVLEKADILAPGGRPLVWMLKLQGVIKQDRVTGLDTLLALCKLAPSVGVSVFLLGSQPAVLQRIKQRLQQEFPELAIAGMESLPLEKLTPWNDEAITQKLNNSGAGLVLVSLGHPKQEIWMAEHKHKVRAVMVGLGGTFPMYAGITQRVPQFVRSARFEGLYRLAQGLSRLWDRYSSTIPIFTWLALKQLVLGGNGISSQRVR